MAVGVFALWLLLAGNAGPASLITGGGIALAASAWARLLEP